MQKPRFTSSPRIVVALVILGVLIVMATTGSLGGLGDPFLPPSSDSSGSTIPTATSITTTTTATTTTTTTAPTTTTTTTTTTSTTTSTTLPLFTAEHPLRVLEVGDSLATFPGYALERRMEIYSGLEVRSVTKQSSGLARPDYYNWPQVLAHTVADFHPHVTVVLLGANDNQPLAHQGGSLKTFSDEWKLEYLRRIDNFLQICTQAGSSVIWVGLPIMKSRSFSETERKLNELYEMGCAVHPGAEYIDGYLLFADGEGQYASKLADESGDATLMRARDGIHFTMDGADRIADAVMEVLMAQFRLERAALWRGGAGPAQPAAWAGGAGR